MSLFFASGDIGGAKVIASIIKEITKKRQDIIVLPHRDLDNLINNSVNRSDININSTDEEIFCFFKKNDVDTYIFTTSVKDNFPLFLSDIAKKHKINTICILDNWVNYKKRLLLNERLIFPNKYIMMDKYAFDEAIRDGVPENILYIGGQPSLSGIFDEYNTYKLIDKNSYFDKLKLDKKKKIILFISEPVEDDQGSKDSENYRGYTEKIVLKKLLLFFQNYYSEIQFLIKPHPRDNIEKLNKIWIEYKGNLIGGVLGKKLNKDIVYFSDGIIGMASILLYEAWLLNKPVISIQPNLINDQLRYLKNKLDPYFIEKDIEINEKMMIWFKEIKKRKNDLKKREELEFHEKSIKRIINLIEGNKK